MSNAPLNTYRVFVLDTSDENNPRTEFAFLSIDGKYKEAWEISRQVLKGKNSQYSFAKEGKPYVFQGKETTIVKITEEKQKVKKVNLAEMKQDLLSQINAIQNNGEMNAKQKQEAMNKLLAE